MIGVFGNAPKNSSKQMLVKALPKDILQFELYPFMHSYWFVDCVRDYPIIEVIESHPEFEAYLAIKYASWYGHLNIVKHFTSKEENMQFVNAPALQSASCGGHLDVVKYLISIDDTNLNLDFAVECASEHGHLDVVKYLVSLGADTRRDNDYAFRNASRHGHLPVVKYLASLGANMDANESFAVRCACVNGHIDVVKYLISQGARHHPFLKTKTFICACGRGRLDVVKYLMSFEIEYSVIVEGFICAQEFAHVVEYLNPFFEKKR